MVAARPRCSVAAATSPVLMASQPQPPKEFVPVDEVPQGEQIPAINLVAAAYGFVWVAVLVFHDGLWADEPETLDGVEAREATAAAVRA